MPDNTLTKAAKKLRSDLKDLTFADPVTHVYNPLEYAWKPHSRFLQSFGSGKKRVVFLGMNPGPYGMAQTGVPFGEIAAVRDWMGISENVDKPPNEHPKRPIEGFDCTRSEVSGRRLWGWAAERFESAEAFFENHFAVNYCPLVWMEDTGRNRTPDKLPKSELNPVYDACNVHLIAVLRALDPEWAVGVGAFAETRLKALAEEHGLEMKIGKILHPSPASPAANRGWAEAATKGMESQGIW